MNLTHHICGDCKLQKPSSEFSKGIKGKYGLQAYCKQCAAERKFKYRYSMTTAEFHSLLSSQGDKCAICKIHVSEYKARRNKRFNFGFVVDHNHRTGKVRGILCNECNVALGQFKDSKESLLNAIAYLEQNKEEDIV